MRRPYLVSLLGGLVVIAAAFLPWLRVGQVGVPGIPDPAGYFVLLLGVIGVLLSAVGMAGRRDTRQGLFLVGLAGVTALVVVWTAGRATVADRAQARAEAVAIVDNVAVQPPPPVTVAVGLIAGLLGSIVIGAVNLPKSESRT